MEPGICIPSERGNFGCKNDVLYLIDKWCSGRESCEFYVLNKDLVEATTNCLDLIVYFHASYNCVEGKLVKHYSSAHSTDEKINNERARFDFSTMIIVAGIIGGTIVLAVAVIVCGVVYVQKYK
ncbi:hypothetical protein LSH36_200g02031 [Paralvinella palmiformis]|uniref:SUEL-type lectin domain-containing protein n=1 Tax=Paralvinella palmiformis TaxID=53620 RepID=A0AAD9JPJ9_9ANNE|nr:hypothetical protein LSH36_200g02031 [Paralvinella palmiformis]